LKIRVRHSTPPLCGLIVAHRLAQGWSVEPQLTYLARSRSMKASIISSRCLRASCRTTPFRITTALTRLIALCLPTLLYLSNSPLSARLTYKEGRAEHTGAFSRCSMHTVHETPRASRQAKLTTARGVMTPRNKYMRYKYAVKTRSQQFAVPGSDKCITVGNGDYPFPDLLGCGAGEVPGALVPALPQPAAHVAEHRHAGLDRAVDCMSHRGSLRETSA
jgi:hypothetical protein